MPLPKYKERRASVCAYLCISIVGKKVLKFRETIALQLDVFCSVKFAFTPFNKAYILYHTSSEITIDRVIFQLFSGSSLYKNRAAKSHLHIVCTCFALIMML